MSKRKRSSVNASRDPVFSPTVLPPNVASLASGMMPPAPVPTRRTSGRKSTQATPTKIDANPDTNQEIKDGQTALRASPDAEGNDEKAQVEKVVAKRGKKATAPPTLKSIPDNNPSESSLSDLTDFEERIGPQTASAKTTAAKQKNLKKDAGVPEDPEAVAEDEEADPEEVKEALSRPPPVNSPYLPLPWKGRLGYACLNTYLRAATPPVFSSRTCRIASILEHRHPLRDPSQPEHATKNRPDKDQPADVARGQAYVEALGLANVRDIPKMLRWNDRYGIKFMRLSSEMFPFASHDVYGYKLAPFASEALAEAGKVAAELGHRLTTHPGQFTQLGSPRPEVITAAIRDLEYHCEMLDLLNLPPQQDRDAVMILHMGGIFGDKPATLDRFRENYRKLSQKIKNRLVLENDDVCYSVHDLLPVCEELNIPFVLDYHHHNIIFDADKIREGTLDIIDMYPRIKATWDRKRITQKMHYSEPCPGAITGRQRRKHNPRVATLPPCATDMDLMIEAKDKEQACFELMRTFKLPGFDTFADLLPYTRNDENKPWKPPKKKTTKKKKGQAADDVDDEEQPDPQPPPIVPDDEVAMGGPDGRVYWPLGMEEWLRPKKREVKPRDPAKALSTAEKAAARRAEKAAWQAAREASAEAAGDSGIFKTEGGEAGAETPRMVDIAKAKSVYDKAKEKESKAKPARAGPKKASAVPTNTNVTPAGKSRKQKSARTVPTPSTSDFDEDPLEQEEEEEEEDLEMPDLTDREEEVKTAKVMLGSRAAVTRKTSGRSAKKTRVKYAESEDEDID